jgi:hypothetical protein
MTLVRSSSDVCSFLQPVWGFICGGIYAKAVRPVPVRVQGIAARHFERGTNYD